MCQSSEKDFTVMTPFNKNGPPAWLKNPTLCPVCHGYGGWISIRNHRGPGKHQIAGCNQCNAWGYVGADTPDGVCQHDDEEVTPAEAGATVFQPGHVYRCKICNRIRIEDSSG